jgi:hypothetical protein
MAYDYRIWQKFKDIMNRGPKIRPATICDLNGKIVYSEQREGVKNLLDPEGVKKSLELAVNAWKTSRVAPSGCISRW